MNTQKSTRIKIPRDRASFISLLIRELKYLEKSCRDFDDGDVEEAVRIATQLRVIFHDGPPRKINPTLSLFTLLNAKEQLIFEDTGVYREKLQAVEQKEIERQHGKGSHSIQRIGDAGLVVKGLIPGTRFHGWFAPLNQKRYGLQDYRSEALIGDQPFDFWWNTPLIEDCKGNTFSRGQLITIMTNQDGGAHVDPSIDEDYHELNHDNLGAAIKLTFQGEAISDFMNEKMDESANLKNNVAFASMRQIAHEACGAIYRFIESISEELSEINKPIRYIPSKPTFQPAIEFFVQVVGFNSETASSKESSTAKQQKDSYMQKTKPEIKDFYEIARRQLGGNYFLKPK